MMLEELQRRDYSAITTRNYLRVVADFAKYFGKSPDKLGPNELRTYQAYLLRERKVTPGTAVNCVAGAFILRSNARRSRWEVGGPYFHGHSVYAMAFDSRGGQHRIWASTQSYWGTMLRSSDDFGKSWTNPHEAPIRFPADTGLSLKNIWQISV